MASKTRDRQWTYKRNNEARSRNHCCCGKAISITYSECLCVCVALVIQHAKRMCGIILSSVAWLALPYFSHIISKWHDFRAKACFDFLYNFVRNISHSKTTVLRYCHKYHTCICILVRLQWHLNLLDRVWKTKFHENPSSGSRVVPWRRTDGQTDVMKLTVAFHNSANVPNNSGILLI
jgi:hypothetical protein